MKIESGNLYQVSKCGKNGVWCDCGIMSAEDAKGIVSTFTLDREMTELAGDEMWFSRKNTANMVVVKCVG